MRERERERERREQESSPLLFQRHRNPLITVRHKGAHVQRYSEKGRVSETWRAREKTEREQAQRERDRERARVRERENE